MEEVEKFEKERNKVPNEIEEAKRSMSGWEKKQRLIGSASECSPDKR